MPDDSPTIEQLQEHFRKLAPPDVPAASFVRDNPALFQAGRWRREQAAAMIGGLLTLPELHANGIRIDWLLRLVVSFANGHKAPTRHDFDMALNAGLSQANIASQEDPSEELFCEQIVTARGNFTVFPGQWVTPTACTQTLLKAFEDLPDSPQKQRALSACYALLTLSEQVARRARLPAMMVGGGTPFETIDLPSYGLMKELSARVTFSARELSEIGIDQAFLATFVMRPKDYSSASMSEPGDSGLEFFPLLKASDGIIIASPQNLTTAMRALLLDTALRGGVRRPLLARLFIAQGEYAEEGGFWPRRSINLSPPDQHGIRQSVTQYEPGRYLHVIQITPDFDGFPEGAFGTVREPPREALKAFVDHIEAFWAFSAGREDRRSTMTIVLMGGWGCPFAIAPEIDESKVPKDWEYAMLSFADCAVLGVAENSHFADVVRVLHQLKILEADGFTFMNPSGLMNTFGYWRMTDGNFIPEHMVDITPPCTLWMGNDELLAPREEAAKRRGYRAVPFPDKTLKTVQRLQWGERGILRAIFACPTDIEKGVLSGAVLREDRTWWIQTMPTEGENREWRYQVWNAALQWLDAVAAGVVAKWPDAFSDTPVRIELAAAGGFTFERVSPREFGKGDLPGSVLCEADALGGRVLLGKDWVSHLGVKENYAELEMIACVLQAISRASGHEVSRDDLKAEIQSILGSRDWRWLHAREAITVQDRMSAGRLVGAFHAIPFSAHTLAKCGSIWTFRKRAEGNVVAGEGPCQEFLGQYREAVLDLLIRDIRTFNREELTKACLASYQAARAEQTRWRSTIRALRAISGDAANVSAFDRQNEINGVQRAAKTVAEIAACEGAQTGGLVPGESELADLFAKALLIFGNGQLFSSIRAGLIKPELRISPAGDLLSEREIFSLLLRPGAEWTTRKALDYAAREYGEVHAATDKDSDRLSWADDLRGAVEAEYQTTAEGFVDLQFALLQLAETRDEGVIVIRKSELVERLVANKQFPDKDPAAFVDRLVLPSRPGWRDYGDLAPHYFDVGKFDRPSSLINRPLLALDSTDDPLLVVAPLMVSDSTMYCFGGLMDGALNNEFWQTSEARRFAGARGDAIGAEFETELASKLTALGLDATPRCKISKVLNDKVPHELGDIDVFVISQDRRRVWIVEAKNLKLCRTENEVAARLAEYRGRMIVRNGRERPDKMLRHLRRVDYVRERSASLQKQLRLPELPEVRGLVIVDSPQPMSVDAVSAGPHAQTILADELDKFYF